MCSLSIGQQDTKTKIVNTSTGVPRAHKRVVEHSNAATNNRVSGMGSSCPKNRWYVCCKYASPINVQALANKLKLYPDRNAEKILLHGFTFGFRLAYKGERCRRDSDNLKSISNLHDKALKKMGKEELQSLIGSLSFIFRAIAPSRAFLRRLIDLTCGVKHAWFKITLTKGAKADLRIWKIFFNILMKYQFFQSRH